MAQPNAWFGTASIWTMWSNSTKYGNIHNSNRRMSINQYESNNTTLEDILLPCRHTGLVSKSALQWCHNERDGVSNHQPHDCLLYRLFRRRSKKTSKFIASLAFVRGMTGEYPAQRPSNAENVSICWRHHVPHRITAEWSMLTVFHSLWFRLLKCLGVPSIRSIRENFHTWYYARNSALWRKQIHVIIYSTPACSSFAMYTKRKFRGTHNEMENKLYSLLSFTWGIF